VSGEKTELKVNNHKMKKMKLINGIAIAIIGLGAITVSCKKEGCTDPLATNYNSKANHDNGSCEYGPGGGGDPSEVLQVTDDIDVPTTWSAGTVEVCGDISVNAALTISPGVNIVMCAAAKIDVSETGSMYAVGTATSPITFSGEVATPGYWKGIGISSNNPNNQFDYVTISGGGGYWYYEEAELFLYANGRLSMKNSTVTNGPGVGFMAQTSTVLTQFMSNTFSSNASYGISVTAKQMAMMDEASNYNAGNGLNFIQVDGEDVSSNQTWRKTNAPLMVTGVIDVNAGLTLNPGVEIQFEAGQGMDVGESGYLYAVGTAAEPITFKGRYASAGYWRGLYIGSNNPNNNLDYVNISDGGEYWYLDYSSLYIQGRCDVDNCTITNSNSWAAIVTGSSTIYCGGSVQSDAAGVTAYNTLTGNGAGADADCVGGGCTVRFD